MSDRLARLETYWKSEAVLGEHGELVEDVLALVEIAKAARKLLDDDPFSRIDSPNRARLRAALSALHGEEGKA